MHFRWSGTSANRALTYEPLLYLECIGPCSRLSLNNLTSEFFIAKYLCQIPKNRRTLQVNSSSRVWSVIRQSAVSWAAPWLP